METAADRAARGVGVLIANGEYGAGDRLPAERDLARQLGLSRPALREGIRRLRSGGVLESRRGSGTYVVEIDLDGVFEVRSKLEPLAAEYSALNRSDEEAAELGALIGVMQDQLDDYHTFATADTKIHAIIASSSRRPVLNTTLERITEMASLTRAVTAPERSSRVESLKDVERVVAAIERQHPRRAANAMERHILHAWEDFNTALKEARSAPAVPSLAAST